MKSDQTPKILGIIPARKGSKRLPRKNLLPIGGVPLVQRTLEMAVQAKLLDNIVVTSDSAEVLSIGAQIKGITTILRPDYLATDTAPAIAYVHHTLDYLQDKFAETYEIIVILQPTSPFTLADDVDQTVQLLLSTQADTVVTVTELDHMIHPLKLKRLDQDRLLPYLEDENGRMAAHEIPKVFVRNGAVYATQMTTIRRDKIIGEDCRAYIMPKNRSVDINDELDYQFAQFLYEKKLVFNA